MERVEELKNKEEKIEKKSDEDENIDFDLPLHLPPRFNVIFSRYFFGVLALFIIILSGILVKPFLTEIFLAFVLFIICKPLYNTISRIVKGKRVLSSLITCIVIIVIIFIPFVIFTGILASQAYSFYQYITKEFKTENLQSYLDIKKTYIISFIEKYIPAIGEYDFHGGEILGKYLGIVSEFIYKNTASIVKGFSSILVSFMLVIFIAFYMFIDGEVFLEEIKRLSPLDDKYDQEILDELIKTIKITFKGSLVIALIQGILGALGLLICGIHSWALWGVIMGISSFIPVLGTALIWVPATIYLLATKHFIAALFLVLWGVLVIGSSDNLIRPYLLKGETNIHPLMIFFSVMGGIAYFGFLGIILGPLILSLFVYILTVYKRFINPRRS